MIKLTVALPVFNSKSIAWLAMESLANQQGIDFDWELIILEERGENSFGRKAFMEYEKKLKNIRCKKFIYRGLNNWVALSHKWRMIGQLVDDNSKVFVMQAADCYSQPFRLKETFELHRGGAEWSQSRYGIFYDVNLDKSILYNQDTIVYPTGLNMAFNTSFARKLPREEVFKGVDNWLYQSIRKMNGGQDPIVSWNISPNWKYGVDTNGLNNISYRRVNYFSQCMPPFQETEITIDEIVPDYISELLKEAGKRNRANLEVRQRTQLV